MNESIIIYISRYIKVTDFSKIKFMKNHKLPLSILLIVLLIIFSVFYACTYIINRTPEDHTTMLRRDYAIQQEFKQNILSIASTNELSYTDSIAMTHTIKRLESLLEEWNDSIKIQHNAWIQVEKTANKNFSIWLAVIAAICTVLPVVLALHQNNTFNEQIQKARESMNNEIKSINDNLETEKMKIKKFSERIWVTELLDMASRNLNVLNNLKELEIKEKILVTCPNEVRIIIDRILENIILCENRLNENFSSLRENEQRTIINSYFCMVCIFREMLYRYESEFSGVNLIRLQQNRYLVNKLINRMIDLEKNPNKKEFDDIDLKQIMTEVREYIVVANYVFKDQLKI